MNGDAAAAAEATLTTVVGLDRSKFTDDPKILRRLNRPKGVCTLPDGTVIIADRLNHKIRRMDPLSGVVTTLAGCGNTGSRDGLAVTAQFSCPSAVAADSANNVIVADSQNHAIRRIDHATGEVSTLANFALVPGFNDGPAHEALFHTPSGVAIDSADNIFVADHGNHRIRRIDGVTGEVSTVCGNGVGGFRDGPGDTAQLFQPADVCLDAEDNLIVADSGNNLIRLVVPDTEYVRTIAGDGTAGWADGIGPAARFQSPRSVVVGDCGKLWVADCDNHCIREVDLETGQVTTVAGRRRGAGNQDGPADTCLFSSPTGLAIDHDGGLLIVDSGNNRLRRLTGVPDLAPLVRSPAPPTFAQRLQRERRELEVAVADRDWAANARDAALAALEEATATLQVVTEAHDARVAAVEAVVAEIEAFQTKVSREGLDTLTEAEAYEVLQLLGVTRVRPEALLQQGITGAVLPYMSEADMERVLKMETLGGRRRLTLAIKRLINGDGFAPPTLAGAMQWSCVEVADWLNKEGAGDLTERFSAEDVDGLCLLALEADDLAHMGVRTVGQKVAVMKKLEALKKQTYAGQVVSGQGEGATAAAAVAPDIREVLAAVLEENASLQRRVAEDRAARAQVPAQFLCPILNDLMEDPVVAADGHMYERAAIEAWFQRSDRSPMTNLAIAPVLIPVLAVRQQIAELKEKGGLKA
eukprot:m.469391 g.469391  ORF g.469391 m.469391 type:complete len:698 (-) comp28501_c0_seq1:273-2366(-)